MDDDERDDEPVSGGLADGRELRWLDRTLTGEDDGAKSTSAADLRSAVQAALAGQATPPTVDPDAIVARLRARLMLDGPASIAPHQPVARHRSLRRTGVALAWATAAAVMITATTQSGGHNIRSVRLGIDDTGSYHTGPGQRLRVQFSDGVELAAAPNTSVRVGRSGGYRALFLRGAVYIDAHDDSSSPLIVHAANALVENAGARFSVLTDPESREVRIAVASGVVLAGDSGAPWHEGHVLTGGTLGIVRSLGATETFRSGDPDDAVLWEAVARQRFAVDELPNGGDAAPP
jgi:ferric-dicitrate binding protein FerR (iron transport regulator)